MLEVFIECETGQDRAVEKDLLLKELPKAGTTVLLEKVT